MTDWAAISVLTERIHAKAHKGWNCDDMNELVHRDHMNGFRRKAIAILTARQTKASA